MLKENNASLKKGVLFIFLLFLFLRLYRLGYHDLWYDEIFTVNYARSPWHNWNAPLYWIFMYFWTKVSGISEFALRLPSAFFSFSSVLFIYLLGKELFDRKTALISSVLMGLSPFQIWYAQEARDYSMALFSGTLSSYLLIKAEKSGRLRFWALFILVSVIGVYTSYFYILLVAAQFLYIAINRVRVKGFSGAFPFLIIALGFSPYLPRFLSKFDAVLTGFWVPVPTWRSLNITLENYLLGYNSLPLVYIACNIIAGILLLSVLFGAREVSLKRPIIFCLSLFLAPVLLAFSFSKLFFSIYLDRGLILFSPYFYLLVALGTVLIYEKAGKFLLTLLLAALLTADCAYFLDIIVTPFEHHVGTYIKKPVKPLAEFLVDNIEQGDVLGYTNECVVPSLIHYSNRDLLPVYRLFDPRIEDTSWKRPIQPSWYDIPLYDIGRLNFKRLWVVSSDWARSGGLDENSGVVKSWLDENFKLELKKEYDGVWIFRYGR